jgi:glycosyltransferase involved in cell wall biosynthesis
MKKKDNILILNTSASTGGALSILQHYYDIAKNDLSNNYYFIVSTKTLQDCSNIKVFVFQWVKLNYLFRLYFELFTIRRLIKNLEISKLLNLQNIGLFDYKVPSTLYIHQSIPFSGIRFRWYINPKYWFYENLYKVLILYSCKIYSEIIVQGIWIKNSIEKNGINKAKIRVEKPILSPNSLKTSNLPNVKQHLKAKFIYPTSIEKYKNYNRIFEAVSIIDSKLYTKFEIVLTINQGNVAKKWRKKINELNMPISFVGWLDRKEVLTILQESILIFPSLVESYPLPLEEAKAFKRPIICSNKEYAKEVLINYSNVVYFDPEDHVDLADKISSQVLNS